MAKHIKFILIFITFSVTVVLGFELYPYVARKTVPRTVSNRRHDSGRALPGSDVEELRKLLLSCGGEEMLSPVSRKNNLNVLIFVKDADKDKLADYYVNVIAKSGWSYDEHKSLMIEKAGAERSPGMRTLAFRKGSQYTLIIGINDSPGGCRVVPVMSEINAEH